jgi:hypothetical protein
LGVAGSNPALEYPENNVPPGPDEMLETITPHQRGNTLDPEVRNPAFRAGRGHALYIALALKLGKSFATLDLRQRRVAEALGLNLVDLRL